ncbi:putative Ig domain-containing protein, partial [Flavobacterium sp. LHD-80]|uniref:beta strand repeat-containing protein n=1 Tax=Flavobacterium sp. LHD-80 TaxID=3071411 RepID=UPI0027E0F806
MIRKLLLFVRSLFLNFSTSSKERSFNLSLRMLCLGMFFVVSFANAATRYSVVTVGDWNAISTWSATSGGTGGASVPVAGDIVYIQNGHTITVTAAAACGSINFTGASATLTVNSGFTLTVSTASGGTGILALNSLAGASSAAIISGLGTISVNTVSTGTSVSPTATATTTLTTTISNLTISGDLDIISSRSGSGTNNATFNQTSGNVTVNGVIDPITANNSASNANIVLGNSNPTLFLGGATPFDVTGNNGVFNTNFTASGSTVNYNRNNVQAARVTIYDNLTLSGTSLKTFATAPTVNNVLSMEGSATISVAPTYGTSATLQYNTATARAAGAEWINTFVASGGVVIASTGTIALNAAKAFSSGVPLTINNGSTLSTSSNNYALDFAGDFINNGGTFAGGSSAITISGAGLQSIGSFSTTGGITMSKTTGAIATLTGSVTAGSLTIDGSGGRLSLGSGLTHTITGNWVRNQGTLNGGSSTLRIGGNITGTGSTFTAESSTVEFYRTGNQSLGGAEITYNNLTLSGSGTKTLGATTTVSNTWSIVSPVQANLGNFIKHGAKTLLLHGSGPVSGSWGSTTSAATNKNDTYFIAGAGITGIINVSSLIDNNYAAYNNSTSNLFASVGENTGPLTLTAPDGYVFINTKFASYGTPGGTAPNYTIGGCHATNSRSVTTGLLGNTTANIPGTGVAFNTAFGDPCSGTIKTYSIVATYALPICSNTSPGIITGSIPTGGNGTSYTYLWEQSTNVNGPYTTVTGTSNAKDYTPGNLTTTTYYRRTVTSGIYTDATIVIVPVISAPTTAPTISLNCSTLSVPASTTPGTYVEWFSTCGGTVLATGVTYNPPSTGTYYARYTNTCGSSLCGSRAYTFSSNSVVITPTSPISICSGTSGNSTVNLPYTSTGTSGTSTYTIIWTPNGYLIDVFDRALSSSPIVLDVPDNAPAGTYTGTIKVKTAAGCVSAPKTFTLTIGKVAGTASSTPTLCINTTLTAITHATTNATGIGTPTGLPAGVTAAWASNVITISGTPTASGTFAYTIPLTGPCIGSADATGTITVNQAPSALSYSTPTAVYCYNTPITSNTATITPGTPAPAYTVSPALPGGLSLDGSTGTISGTPTGSSAAANYVITATNSCGSTTATVNITVNRAPSALSYSTPTAVYCYNTPITSNTVTITPGTPAPAYTVSPALPGGLSLDGSTGAISGTPTGTSVA